MIVLLNYRKGNIRLKEGLESLGHFVEENLWDINIIVEKKIGAVIFGFKRIFKNKLSFLKLALRLKKAGIPIITWNFDAPWHMGISQWKVDLLLNSGVLDIYATHSLQNTEGVKNTKILYLPNAVPISQYNLMGNTLEGLRNPERYKWDVSFLGNIDSVRYPEHNKRVLFLKSLENQLKEKGITYLFLDSQNMPTRDQVDIIQRSRINLSSLSAADSKDIKSWGLPERCYGIPACGGFLLMDNRVHVKDDFLLHEEAVTYNDVEDCIEKILYYLPKHEEMRMIAERAHARVMRDHTYQERVKTLVNTISYTKNWIDLGYFKR